MILSDTGKIIESVWQGLPAHIPEIEMDQFIVMPNHIHGIVVIGSRVSLSDIMRRFKSYTATLYRRMCGSMAVKLWQRSFHDRVLRNESELKRMREYIINNPLQWAVDEENPEKSTS